MSDTTARERTVHDRTVPDWVQLGDDEQVVWRSRPSGRAVFPSFLPGAVVVLLGLVVVVLPSVVPDLPEPLLGWLVPAGALLVVAGVALATARYVRWQSTQYLLTSTGAYKKSGILSRSVDQLRLTRVESVSHSQSATQRLLGYGDVVVSTEGTNSRFVLEDVPNPTNVHNLLSSQLDGRGRRE